MTTNGIKAMLAAALLSAGAHAQSGGLAPPLELVTYVEEQPSLNQAGASLATEGNYLFIGVPGDAGGRVDVRYRVPLGYIVAQRLRLPSEPAGTCSQFGRSIAADGTALVVGAQAGGSGRAIVYRWSATDFLYHHEATLSSGGGVNDLFGERVAVLDGELVAVCARGALAVHVFEAGQGGTFSDANGLLVGPVSAGVVPNNGWSTGFGSDVAVGRFGGEVSVLVGMRDACFYQRPRQAPAPDEHEPNEIGATAARTGGVAVLAKTDGAWKLRQRLIPDWSKTKDFGAAIDVEGERVAVGAIYSNLFSGGKQAGSASLFEWRTDALALIKTTWPSSPSTNGLFGYAVKLAGDYLLVGQPAHWGGPAGIVEVFRIAGGELERVEVIAAHDGNGAANANALGDCFGRAIAVNRYGEVIVAAPLSAINGSSPQRYGGGELYLFR